VSKEVEESEIQNIQEVVQDLHDTMMDFRERYGVGRAIAAPQIGVMKRVVYMHIDIPVVFLNPILKNKSDEMIELWDDCMCFPDLLVRVQSSGMTVCVFQTFLFVCNDTRVVPLSIAI
jgi:peptide deformylase